MVNHSPYITFVIAARNDNYGGHFLHRIKTFFHVLLFYLDKYKLESEIIVVEWNPPRKTVRLYQELQTLLKSSPVPIRFIEVPHGIHQNFANSAKIPIFEYIAKNVGIRRAIGKYILVTNPDILFPEAFIKYLSLKSLSPTSFYRTDRIDVDTNIPLSFSPEKKVAFAKTHSYSLNTLGQTVSLSLWLPFIFRCYLGYLFSTIKRYQQKSKDRIEDKVHVNAAGDFLLMAKKNWLKLRGFPELPTHYLIDGYLCCLAINFGLKQKCLPLPLAIFHSDHNRPTASRPKTSYDIWVNDCRKMISDQKTKVFNSANWGLGKVKLQETVVPTV